MAVDEPRFSELELDRFREKLLERRTEMLSSVIGAEAAEEEPDGKPGEEAEELDHSSASSDDDDMPRRLAENERDVLLEIDRALERVDDGSFGVCEVTGRPIERERLERRPWTRLSVEGERRQGKRRG